MFSKWNGRRQASNQQRHEHNNTFEDIFQNDNSLSNVNVSVVQLWQTLSSRLSCSQLVTYIYVHECVVNK